MSLGLCLGFLLIFKQLAARRSRAAMAWQDKGQQRHAYNYRCTRSRMKCADMNERIVTLFSKTWVSLQPALIQNIVFLALCLRVLLQPYALPIVPGVSNADRKYISSQTVEWVFFVFFFCVLCHAGDVSCDCISVICTKYMISLLWLWE